MKLEIIKLKQLLAESETNAQMLSNLNEQSEQRFAEAQEDFATLEEEYGSLQSDCETFRIENQRLKSELAILKKKLSVYETPEQDRTVLRTLSLLGGKENRCGSTDAAVPMLTAFKNITSSGKGNKSPLREINGNAGQSPPIATVNGF